MMPNPLELPLRDIHLPPPVHWWPLAVGWWIVLGIIISLIIVFLLLKKISRRSHFKKQAKQALDRIEKKLATDQQAIDCLADLSVLIRRLTLKQNLPSGSAGLTGQAWLKHLDQPLKKPEFSQGAGQILLTGPYQKDANKEEVLQLIKLCRKWVSFL